MPPQSALGTSIHMLRSVAGYCVRYGVAMIQTDSKKATTGFIALLGAYFIWGTLAPYWKSLSHIDIYTVLSHRLIWLVVFTFIVLLLQGRLGEVRAILKDRKTTVRLALSSVMFALNAQTFYIAVNSNRVLEGSLGDFLTPLMTIGLGCLILRERLSVLQCLAVVLPCLAMVSSFFTLGTVPVMALVIGASFAFYGLIRREVTAKPLPSMLVESFTLLPLALAYLAYRKATGFEVWGGADAPTVLLIMGTGVVTGLPTLLFALGAPHVRMATLGIIQYLSPTLIFLMGVLLYDETLSLSTAQTFALTWTGIILYSFDSMRERRRNRRRLHPPKSAHAHS
ncbi:EamA family transporter RarD [Desulfobaculum senezii]